MVYIVMDVEATCWERGTDLNSQEIIEIGAVKLDGSLELLGQFDSFVRPLQRARLSQFCTNLTTITQEDVESAECVCGSASSVPRLDR